MNESTTDQLIAGYTAYTSAEEFGPTAEGDSPAATPIIVISAISVYEVTRR
ncbi:LxmA leader domain family RiPP [Streptomyces sp. AJS327]|uniref:LxmA leader domain family RiPP n=1 Tax=Streptomyces sp. AJS327 TaxID=2545265 RepID=UPI0015DDC332|nr:LxmA leader domain family RiPP [Streptomyces sp. AJS327]